MVTGFLISLLGGSKTQIGGPTGAFVVVVSGIVAKYGVEGLYICTMMAGVILAILGLTGMGTAVKFIPRPIVIGFTNGIALLIASTQIKDFFGVEGGQSPGRVPGAHGDADRPRRHVFRGRDSGGRRVSLAVILLFVNFIPKVPGTIVALFGSTVAVTLLQLNVATIGTKFGGIPSGLPTVDIPEFHWRYAIQLIGSGDDSGDAGRD